MTAADAPRPTIRAEDLAELAEDQEREAAARRRAVGLHDAERKKRAQLAAALVEELKRPLVEGHAPTDLERLAELQPGARPVRQRGAKR